METGGNYQHGLEWGRRRQLGQFFTPLPVARFMCRWLLARGKRRLFDPAFGLGAFYLAARKLLPDVRFEGFEKDAAVLAHFRQINPFPDDGHLHLENTDYFRVWDSLRPAIVCNPPYMRFQKIPDRHKVLAGIERRLGNRLPGHTNLAVLFLLKSLLELAPGGCLAYLMPLEFLNTGYGEPIKRILLAGGRLKALLRIEPEKEVFPEAVTSVGIVLTADDGKSGPVQFRTIQSLGQLEQEVEQLPGRSVPERELHPADKWLRHFEETGFPNRRFLQPLSWYGTCSRGIATGANEFFLLSRSKVSEWKLPFSILRPCISRSAQVEKTFLTNADMALLIDQDAPVLLVNPVLSADEAVRRYIAFGEQHGYDQRYLTRQRNPWFKVERRRPAPILVGTFSRNRIKVIRNMGDVLSLTCFHGFYPGPLGTRFLDHLFLYLLSPAGQKIISMEMRRYGNRLDKFEPHDLNRVLVPSPEWFAAIPEDVVSKTMSQLREEGWSSALSRLFDDLISGETGNEQPAADQRGCADVLPSDGKWKMENGKWKMENGKWKMENGKWKMENGK